MLTELVIKNFAIIDDVTVSFDGGFSVLTGETGAGKSMIISAVNLLLGSRASADLVRTGCDAAELEACFEISPDSRAAGLLEEQGMESEEGLVIRRLIMSSGKSRVFVNSRVSTLEFLKQVTADLAAVSSQHAHQGLLNPENHLAILDEYAGGLALRNKVESIFRELLPLKKNLQILKEDIKNREKELDFLSFQVNEIEDAAVMQGEDSELEEKRQILTGAAQSFEAVNAAVHQIYDREGSLMEIISAVRQDLERTGMADKRIEDIAGRLSAIQYDLQDIAGDLRSVSATIDLDPASLEAVDQRLDLISKLKRKYGPSLDDLFETYEQLKGQLAQTDRLEDEISAHEQRIETLETAIRKKALELSTRRKKAAKSLSEEAGRELGVLEMQQARFDVSFEMFSASGPEDILTDTGGRIVSSGSDKVQFLLSPNPGEDLKPLAKIASGGELSRIVLALKAVLSRNQSLETLIFDEVDAGIGGAVSQKVGLKLKQLAERHQVICITHLAQIAKFARYQFRISKSVVNNRTSTTIVPLETDQERIEEIARMIGGSDISSTTLSHAKELLDNAFS